jgi:hypothetical protein
MGDAVGLQNEPVYPVFLTFQIVIIVPLEVISLKFLFTLYIENLHTTTPIVLVGPSGETLFINNGA